MKKLTLDERNEIMFALIDRHREARELPRVRARIHRILLKMGCRDAYNIYLKKTRR